ncbi:acyl-CoA carboxylase subunit epsilon [Streptomyces sp. RB6PN25]|uniref:Acyl-CoA carboxylase subunit epsilon n=1 Tax=Streptomyces humicola TaxID=2953240 RepID=A0ABT1Q0L5_9ACTN|nr:acyl-CoA carboxylase subunit epsilon [Streptomyces humicola]MCQ4082913.1 acyl-CoA carboxylase subunit epsilon [Streptomyces humicola]
MTVIRIVRGNPDEAELAAVTLVLLAAARCSPQPRPERGRPRRHHHGDDLRGVDETPWMRDLRHRWSLVPRAFEGDGHL